VWDVCNKFIGPREASFYNDPKRQEQFSNRYSPKPQPIEAAGVFRSNILSHGLKQNTTEYLKLHVDNQKDDRPKLLPRLVTILHARDFQPFCITRS
jgi:hypothetical protein